MDFLEKVGQGIAKANQSKEAIAQVDAVFSKLNSELALFPSGELQLVRGKTQLKVITEIVQKINRVESAFFEHDVLLLSLQTRSEKFSEVASGWRQHITGYPCTLKFGGQDLICVNEGQLISGLAELLSSIEFGNVVNLLVEKTKPPSGPSKTKSVKKPVPRR